MARNKTAEHFILTGKVIKIVDGDTYDILLGKNVTQRIRMAGIDAPEKGMPFYRRSKEFLSELCIGETVRIKRTDIDRNGRWIAQTYNQNGTELGLLMIQSGYAWHFKKYSSDIHLAQAERKAQQEKLGLWIEPQPTPPWEWRMIRRNKKTNQTASLN